MKMCSVENCERKHYAKEFCQKHWSQVRRNGCIIKSYYEKSPEERFHEKYLNCGKDNCWNWIAAKDSDGYGRFRDGKSKHMILAHRFSYEIFHGQTPSGLFVCHTCDNPSCVNPSHLFLGSQKQNMNDMAIKERWRGYLGDEHYKSALTSQQVILIRESLLNSISSSTIAREYNVSKSAIEHIRHNRSWKHLLPKIINKG